MLPSSTVALAALCGLIVVVLLSALMLMASVKWSEGYAYSFMAALKVTLLTLVATTVAQLAVSMLVAALLGNGIAGMLLSSFASLLGVAGVSVWLYARRISSPSGEPIGVKRAIKVTVVQTVILFGVALVAAIALVFMAQRGWITLPSPTSLGIGTALAQTVASFA